MELSEEILEDGIEELEKLYADSRLYKNFALRNDEFVNICQSYAKGELLEKLVAIQEGAKKSQKQEEVDASERENLKAAFQKTFDDHGSLKMLTKILRKNRLLFTKSNEYLSAYVALIQTTGIGKSRLAVEYAKLNTSFYICLREKESSGIPARSPLADILKPSYASLKRLFQDETSEMADLYVTYYLCFLGSLMIFLNGHLKDGNAPTEIEKFAAYFFSKQVNSGNSKLSDFSVVVETQEKMLTLCADKTQSREIYKSESKFKLFALASQLLHGIAAETNQLLKNRFGEEKVRNMNPVVLILDEARALLEQIDKNSETDRSYFYYFRLAWSFCKDKLKIPFFALVLDTFGSVGVYLPYSVPDPSLRLIKGNKLFAPITLLPFQKVKGENLTLHSKQELNEATKRMFITGNSFDEETWQKLITDMDLSGNLLKTGRYLWQSYSNAATAVDVAKYKLLFGEEASNDDEERNLQFLAVASSRLAITFHVESKRAETLVHSHGSTLYHVNEDRTKILSGYPAEPVMASAAARLQKERPAFAWKNLLDWLIDQIQNGVVEAGYRGELVARIILLMAMDRSRSEDDVLFTKPVKLEEFFSELFGKDAFEENVATDEQLKEGFVSFTHFVYVDYEPDIADLERLFKCNCAIICRRNEPYIDFIIPVLIWEGGGYKLSYILVQVKNYEDGNGLKEVPTDVDRKVKLLKKNDKDRPFLYFFLQCGPKKYQRQTGPMMMELDSQGKPKLPRSPDAMPTRSSLGDMFDFSDDDEMDIDQKGVAKRLRISHDTDQMDIVAAFTISNNVYPFLSDDEVEKLNELRLSFNDPHAVVTKYGKKMNWDDETMDLVKEFFSTVFFLSSTEKSKKKK